MTTVDFHTGLAEPLGYACRLLRKARQSVPRILVTAPSAALQRLDAELWVFDPQEFLPHLRVREGQGASSAQASLTPILLSTRADEACEAPLWLNLGAEAASEPARFERIIELVAADDEELARARVRWRRYAALGMQVRHHPAKQAG